MHLLFALRDRTFDVIWEVAFILGHKLMFLIISALMVFFLRALQNFNLDPVGSTEFVADLFCEYQASLQRSEPWWNFPKVGFGGLVFAINDGAWQRQRREICVDLGGPVRGVQGNFHLQSQHAGRGGKRGRHITSPELEGSSWSRHLYDVNRGNYLNWNDCSRNGDERCHSEHVLDHFSFRFV